jgi:hypothetical protein
MKGQLEGDKSQLYVLYLVGLAWKLADTSLACWGGGVRGSHTGREAEKASAAVTEESVENSWCPIHTNDSEGQPRPPMGQRSLCLTDPFPFLCPVGCLTKLRLSVNALLP